MEKLKEQFMRNGVHYLLVKRTDTVAMVMADFKSYEVFDIMIRPEELKTFPDGITRSYPLREDVLRNSEFGILNRSLCFVNKELAEKYYALITEYSTMKEQEY